MRTSLFVRVFVDLPIEGNINDSFILLLLVSDGKIDDNL